jgi:hypothetical protein
MTAETLPPARAAAAEYIQRGWSPIQLRRGSKAAREDGWQNQRLGMDDLGRFGADSNVGVLLGEPSRWLVDVDLDCPEAILLAPKFLPATGSVFGRDGKPRSHWIYYAHGAATKRMAEFAPAGDKPQMLVELRSSGLQTIFPGSVHPSKQPVRWDTDGAPAEVSAAAISEASTRLAVAAQLLRLGCDAETACAMAHDNVTLLGIRGEHGRNIQEWLGIARPKPAQQNRTTVDLQDAVQRYNQEHSREFPKSGGDCPICSHKDCFGRMPGANDRWYCFSASHGQGGTRGRNGFHGDALDLDAAAAGLKPVELLRREGYLPERHLRPVAKGGGEGGSPLEHEPREIVIGTDVERVTDEALLALAESGAEVYHRGGVLVQVVADEATVAGVTYTKGTPRLAPIGPARLLELMSSSARWCKIETRGQKGDEPRAPKPAMPPGWAVKTVTERGRWPMLKRVASVIEAPVLRPDGTVITEPGYDEATGLLYRPSAAVKVPDKPTKLDAELARDVLLDAVCDFPFASEAYKASWLAMALTPFARYAFEGPAPLSLIDANTRGSGKSLLADVVAHAATGRPAPRMSPAEDENEERKRITALALSGDRLVLIDNVAKKLGTPALDAALTSTWWRDRLLGASQTFEGELKAVFMATGNNVELGGDMSRRALHIRLESPHERPEQREGFKHPHLLSWLGTSWPGLAAAACTVLRAYCLDGRPEQKVKQWGSYEGWNRLVAHCVVWLGMADPNEARQELVDAADTERRALGLFMAALKAHATWGTTARDLLAEVNDHPQANKEIRAALLEWCPGRAGDPPDAKVLGRKLAASKGRIVGGYCLAIIGEERSGAVKWGVKSAN